jgi:hypothetical protein
LEVKVELQGKLGSEELKKLINHLARLEGFEFIIDPSFDCKIKVTHGKLRPLSYGKCVLCGFITNDFNQFDYAGNKARCLKCLEKISRQTEGYEKLLDKMKSGET